MKKTDNHKQKFFKTDRDILFISLFLAFLLWFLVKMGHEYTHTEKVNIIYNTPQSKSITNNPPKYLYADYTSGGWQLLKLSLANQQKSITLNLTNSKSQVYGSSDLVNYLKNNAQFDNITINRVNLNLIQIELEDKQTKNVPIRDNGQISIKKGFVGIDPIEFIPDSITISGPLSLLQEINEINPNIDKEIELAGNEVVEIALDNPYPDYVKMSVTKAHIKAHIEQLIEKSFFVPIRLINVLDSIEIFPSTVKVTFNLPLSSFNSIKSEDFIISANFEKRKDQLIPLNIETKPSYIRGLKLDVAHIEFIEVNIAK